jgi:hypothetical protein
MTHGTDIDDRSVHRFHGTATDLATGASGPAIFTHPLGAPTGVVLLTAGVLPVTQFEIPRYADGTTHPSGTVRGMGPVSVIQGTSYGSESGSDPQVIVKTQDYEQEGVKQWQNESGTYPAVLVPTIADLTIAGRDYDGSGYTFQGFHYNTTPIPSEPRHAPQTPLAVRGTSPGNEGATFNNSTSMARNNNANLLNGEEKVTVCFWARAANWGEDAFGRVIAIGDGDAATDTAFRIYHMNDNSLLAIDKLPGPEMSGNFGRWTVPFADRQWNAVCVRLDFSLDTNNPTVRINKLPVTPTETSQPAGMQNAPTNAYTVGNNSTGSGTWDGQIAHVQVWNRILSDSEADAAVDDPGSVTTGLRLYLPLTHATDTNDQSGLGFHVNVTPTNLLTHPGFYDREIGLGMRASGSRIKGVRHFNIAGPAAKIIRPTGSTLGSVLPFDEEMVEIDDVSIYRCYSGYELNAADTQLGSYEAEFLRDWGLKFKAGGGYKIRGPVHVSGVYSGRPDSQSPAVWFASDVGLSFGGPWYVENSDIGMLLESSGAKPAPFYSHTCIHGNLRILGQRNTISNFEINVLDGVTKVNGREGIYIFGPSTTLSNGTTGAPVPNGEIAIRAVDSGRERLTLNNIILVGTDNSTAPLIQIRGSAGGLDESRIDVKFVDGGVGLDLNTDGANQLGTGNIIRITATSMTGSAVNLNSAWNDVDNEIYINGVLQSNPNYP